MLNVHLLNKQLYVHIMENYTAINVNEINKCYQHGKNKTKPETKIWIQKQVEECYIEVEDL